MPTLDELFGYIQVASLVVSVASALAALTPTPKDDEWVAKVYKIVDVLALNVGKAKQLGK